MIITSTKKIDAMKADPDRYVYRGLTVDEKGEYYAIIDDRVRQTTDHVLEMMWDDMDF